VSPHGTASYEGLTDLPPLVERAVDLARREGFAHSCRFPLVTLAPAAPPATPIRPRNRRNVTTRRLYPYQCRIATVPAAPPPLPARRIQGHQGHQGRQGTRNDPDLRR